MANRYWNPSRNKPLERILLVDNADGTYSLAVSFAGAGAGTVNTGLGVAEDAAHVSGATGVLAMSRRIDAAASSADTSGDNATINTDASGRLWTHVGAIDAGETHLGEIGGKTIVVKPTIAVDTAIYAALDVLGAAAVSGVVELAGAARVSGGTVVLESIAVYDDDNEKNPITLLFFDSAPASGTYTGNGPLALSAGDKGKYIGRVNIAAGDYETQGGDAFACIRGIGLAMQASGSSSLYMIPMVTSGTPTYTTSSDIKMVLSFLAD